MKEGWEYYEKYLNKQWTNSRISSSIGQLTDVHQ